MLPLKHSHETESLLKTEFGPHLIQSFFTVIKPCLHTHSRIPFVKISSLFCPQGVTGSKHVPSAAILRGGTQTQFPDKS